MTKTPRLQQIIIAMDLKQKALEKELLAVPEVHRTREYRSKSVIGTYESRLIPDKNSEVLKIESIYQEAQIFIKDVDLKINNLKKYNEAQVLKKYEGTITALNYELDVLKTRLEYEENVRNPTKEYMHNILNQLLTYKKDNERLAEEVKASRETIKTLKEEGDRSKKAIHNLEVGLKKKVERLPSIKCSGSEIPELISRFIQEKQSIKEILNINTTETKLQSYLKNIQKQKPSWDVLKLLVEIDKFLENEGEKAPQIDLWKVRYGMSERFNKIRESITPTPREKVNRSDKAKKMKEMGIAHFSARRLSNSEKIS